MNSMATKLAEAGLKVNVVRKPSIKKTNMDSERVKELVRKMEELEKPRVKNDVEENHVKADSLLLDMVKELSRNTKYEKGCKKFIEVFNNIEKFYS